MKASVTTGMPAVDLAETLLKQPDKIKPKAGTKARIISVSTLYVTVELLEPTNLQPGQTVSVSTE